MTLTFHKKNEFFEDIPQYFPGSLDECITGYFGITHQYI